MIEKHLLHPVAVHFPIALLIVGLVFCAWAKVRPRSPWAADAASWMLWIGAALAWAALGLGVLAEETAPGGFPETQNVVERHEALAYWTAGLFTALSAWRLFLKRRAEGLFLAAWLAGVGLLLATAWYGGELVYGHGLGVQPRLEAPTKPAPTHR